MASFTPSRAALASGVVVLAAAFALRLGLVDNATIGHACEAGDPSLVCGVRLAVHDGFRSLAPGFAAVLAGLWCLWRPRAAAVVLTLALAGLGLFLFNAWPAGLALTLLLLSLGRPAPSGRTA